MFLWMDMEHIYTWWGKYRALGITPTIWWEGLLELLGVSWEKWPRLMTWNWQSGSSLVRSFPTQGIAQHQRRSKELVANSQLLGCRNPIPPGEIWPTLSWRDEWNSFYSLPKKNQLVCQHVLIPFAIDLRCKSALFKQKHCILFHENLVAQWKPTFFHPQCIPIYIYIC